MLNLLDSWVIGDSNVQQFIPQVIGLREPTQKEVGVAGRSLQKTSKLSLLLLGQFQIENCIRSIVRNLKIVDKSIGFYKVAEKLITELNMSHYDLETLNTPALIRNSLHSNGIHHSIGKQAKTIKIEIDGIEYKFVDGEAVHCASIEHVAHALEGSLCILEKVFNHPIVKTLPDPIEDEYMMYYKRKTKKSKSS